MRIPHQHTTDELEDIIADLRKQVGGLNGMLESTTSLLTGSRSEIHTITHQLAEAKAESNEQSEEICHLISLNKKYAIQDYEMDKLKRRIAGLEGALFNDLSEMERWRDSDICDCDGNGHTCGLPRLKQSIAQAAAALAAEPSTPCGWTFDEDYGKYDTECGHTWEFTYDDIEANGVKFCPFCGKSVALPEKPCNSM